MSTHVNVFAHVLPPKFLQQILEIVPNALDQAAWMKHPLLSAIDQHVASLPTNERQVISSVNLNPEELLPADDPRTISLCRAANNEMLTMIRQYPQAFVGAVGMVPMNDIDAACQLIDEQVAPADGLAGIQLFTRAMGKPISDPSFDPIFEKMNNLHQPIWLHPVFDERLTENSLTFSWEYEQTKAMDLLVQAGIFKRYPDLKIIVHHAGAMVPFFAERIRYIEGPAAYAEFKRFYVDTAILGNPKALALAVDFFGADHVLYGTDAPLGIPSLGAAEVITQALNDADLTAEQLALIFHDNWQMIKQGVI